jgi:hypothetical protein
MKCDVQAIDSTSRNDIGEYAVLFYFPDGPYVLTTTFLEKEKTEIESYISSLKNDKLEDWYRVKNKEDIDMIIKYANKPKIQGISQYLSPTW